MSKYCPICQTRYNDTEEFCEHCEDVNGKSVRLITEQGGVSLGDANAISGGLNLHDSHNVSTVSNITNNITNIAPQMSDIDTLQEKKNIFLAECKRAFEDGILDSSEEVHLKECRIKLGLDENTAKGILDTVRLLTDQNSRKSSLNPIAKTKLKILSDNLLNNNVVALRNQLGNLAAIVNKYEHDELSRKYFLTLAVLDPRKCIEMKEESTTDSYWKSYWSYLAYIKENQTEKAEELLAGLDRFADYPEDNLTILATAGALMAGNTDEAREFLDAVTGDYTPDLQRFVDSVYLILDPETAGEMGANATASTFFLVNMFGQKDPKVAAAEDAERKSKEEAERKAKDEAERKAKEEAERKVKEEAKAVEGQREKKEKVIKKQAEKLESKSPTDVTKQLISEEKYDEALKELRPLANSGDPTAQYQLGVCYYNGWGIKQNYSVASSWFKKSAISGYVPAIYAMGIRYEEGIGVNVDSEEAAKWYRMAAKQGHADSQFRLGKMYDEGRGVNQNVKQSLALLEDASQNGSVEAKEYLNTMKTRSYVCINKIRFEKEVLFIGKPSLRIHINFDAINLKGKVLNCSVFILHDKYIPTPVQMNQNDPKEFSTNGELSVGANSEKIDGHDVSFSDLCFTIPYYYLCEHDAKGPHPLIARVYVFDVSKKKPQQLTVKDKKFTITCKKKLLSDVIYDVTW